MACSAVDGAGHGERGWPARAGAGWGRNGMQRRAQRDATLERAQRAGLLDGRSRVGRERLLRLQAQAHTSRSS